MKKILFIFVLFLLSLNSFSMAQEISIPGNVSSLAPAASLFFQKGALRVDFFWEKGPADMGESSEVESVLRVEFKDASSHQAKVMTLPWSISFKMLMGNHAHGTAPVQVESVLDDQGEALPGVYRISKIYFSMPGMWKAFVKVIDVDTREELKFFSVNVSPSQD